MSDDQIFIAGAAILASFVAVFIYNYFWEVLSTCCFISFWGFLIVWCPWVFVPMFIFLGLPFALQSCGVK
jgi:hypothetical protein